jgi:Fucose 4-O-acetylase and related acetyltransferases
MHRNDGIDRLRVLLTLLVIFHHVAIAYGGSGAWYWREEADFSNLWLVAFNAINQSFFMGLFFLLAGYFTAPSFARKSARAFLKDRCVRLGLPWLVYFFLLSPLTIALAREGFSREVGPYFIDRILTFDLEPGPLWFTQALLLFSVVYAGFQLRWPRSAPMPLHFPPFATLFAIAILLGTVSFLLRLWIPVGDTVLWLQLGYFPCYVFLFAAGCAAAQERILERITESQVLPWLALTFVGIATLPLALHGAFGTGSFDGGWNANALFYALWDPLTGFGIMLVLLWAARHWAAQPSALWTFLTRHAYAVYVIHPPVVVATSIAFAQTTLAPSMKFLVVGTVASVGCFILATALLALPGVKRVL